MTLHVCPRVIYGLLLFAAVLLRWPTPASAPGVAAALEDRTIYVLRLESAGLPPTLLGCALPYRYVESNDMAGRTICQVESVEVGVELRPDVFTRAGHATSPVRTPDDCAAHRGRAGRVGDPSRPCRGHQQHERHRN